MPCSILLAVDDSKNSAKAVDFVRNNMQPDASVTILAILPKAAAACGMDSPSLAPVFKENKNAFCSLEDAKRDRMRAFVQEARDSLIRSGFTPKNVSVRVRKQKAGVARDILKEGREGGYDVLVMGRRGLSGVQEFLFGSVSHKVIQQAVGVSVIVVD